jgi:hypothetical protein
MNKTKVIWMNREGQIRSHTLFDASYNYALNWFQTTIIECQGVLTIDEKRNSKLKLLKIIT